MAALPESADVVIIGAGIVGGACFYELATAGRGLRIAAFEQHHKLAGSTARSAAAFRHQFSAAVNVEMSLLASRRYSELPGELGCGPVIRRSGYCFVYRDPAALEEAAKRAARQRSLGVPDVEVLDAAATLARFPALEPAGLAGATFCRHDGFVLPDVIANAFFERGQEIGGCLKQYAPVTRIATEGGRASGVVVALEGGEREVRAPVVINATGPWANLVARTAGLEIPVVPVKRYLYFTKQLRERDVRGFPMFVMDLEAYCRPEANGLMLGWDGRPKKPEGWSRFPPPRFEAADLDADRIEPGYGIGASDYGMEVLAQIAEYLPFVAEETALEAVSSGYYEVTPDEKAIVDWDPRLPGLLHAAGFSGHGVMHAPATGRLVRALVLGEKAPVDQEALALGPLLENRARKDPEEVVI
ncbi:MAG TPA: FAD-dependent oxidoreductase [Planctomycetota bacterium]|nr:FAD-dependent oxidoreductase [Planctomycetota bacterium]